MDDGKERKPSIAEEAAVSDGTTTGATTDEDVNDENESPLRSYLNQMGEIQRESMSKLLESTVDASCLPSCENGLENQLDVLMHCHQPLSFLQFFEHHDGHMYDSHQGGGGSAGSGMVEPVGGAYVAPRSCEYCGASTITLCPASCTRPKLYFRKQRPPFASPEHWDPVTEYALPPPPPSPPTTVQEQAPQQPQSQKKQSSSSNWVSELFGVRS